MNTIETLLLAPGLNLVSLLSVCLTSSQTVFSLNKAVVLAIHTLNTFSQKILIQMSSYIIHAEYVKELFLKVFKNSKMWTIKFPLSNLLLYIFYNCQLNFQIYFLNSLRLQRKLKASNYVNSDSKERRLN